MELCFRACAVYRGKTHGSWIVAVSSHSTGVRLPSCCWSYNCASSNATYERVMRGEPNVDFATMGSNMAMSHQKQQQQKQPLLPRLHHLTMAQPSSVNKMVHLLSALSVYPILTDMELGRAWGTLTSSSEWCSLPPSLQCLGPANSFPHFCLPTSILHAW